MRNLLLLALIVPGLVALSSCSDDDDPTSPGEGGGGDDTTAPTLVSFSPADGATDVEPDAIVRATFNEALDPETVDETTFVLRQGAVPLSGTVTVDGAEVTYVPAVALVRARSHNVRVTTDITDLAGNPIAELQTWTFVVPEEADATAPTVTSFTPASGATGVAAGTNVVIQFSEAIDPASVTSTSVRLLRGSQAVGASRSTSGSTVTLDPSSDLAGETTYTVQVGTGVRDLAGNALATARTWTFTTADATGPTVVSNQPVDTSIGFDIDDRVLVRFSEPVRQSSVNNSTFVVQADTWVDGTFEAVLPGNFEFQSDDTVLWRPQRGRLQEFETVYTVRLTDGIQDLAGNPLAPASFVFTTTFLDTDYWYHVKNELRGDSFALGVFTDTYVAVLYPTSSDFSSTYWYGFPAFGSWRLRNNFLGDGHSLEGWDGSRLADMQPTGDFTGQYWSFEFVSGRTSLPTPPQNGESPVAYRLRTQFQGSDRSLSARLENGNYVTRMEDDSNYVGSWWYLENRGRRSK
ncbi:MAG TPA: Ig-like domain-containing protein [Candidatus Krumholzibacteria bacterium]|nr:Ig-like domain-containing protein [Candidatus Krumholzibacteria bacterium]